MRKPDQDVYVRSATGAAFLAIMILGILQSSLSTLFLFSIIVTVAGYEFGRMTKTVRPMHMAIMCLAFFYGMSGTFTDEIHWWYPFLITAVLMLIPTRRKGYIYNLGLRAMGVILISASFALLSSDLLAGPKRHGILAFFAILWTSDTMAYVFGRLFGKHKLWPRISPGKTWEGFIGAIISSAVAGYFIYGYIGLSPLTGVILAILISAFGTLGDLLESALKRKAGVKDSGYFMPGHGGMLDRFDGVMLAAPVVYCFLILFG